jgi:hypothetical protein
MMIVRRVSGPEVFVGVGVGVCVVVGIIVVGEGVGVGVGVGEGVRSGVSYAVNLGKLENVRRS